MVGVISTAAAAALISPPLVRNSGDTVVLLVISTAAAAVVISPPLAGNSGDTLVLLVVSPVIFS